MTYYTTSDLDELDDSETPSDSDDVDGTQLGQTADYVNVWELPDVDTQTTDDILKDIRANDYSDKQLAFLEQYERHNRNRSELVEALARRHTEHDWAADFFPDATAATAAVAADSDTEGDDATLATGPDGDHATSILPDPDLDPADPDAFETMLCEDIVAAVETWRRGHANSPRIHHLPAGITADDVGCQLLESVASYAIAPYTRSDMIAHDPAVTDHQQLPQSMVHIDATVADADRGLLSVSVSGSHVATGDDISVDVTVAV